MDISTAHKGKPHISAEMWAELNRGIAGNESYVMEGGQKFKSELVSNNLLKIYDGSGMMQGRHVFIPVGQSDELTIENGNQGMKRIDLVVVRYTKNENTKIEDTDTIVIKGTPSESNPVAPAHIEGDIRAGDMKADWPLYEVELDGISVIEVRPLFNVLMNMSMINKSLLDMSDGMPIFTGYKNVSTSYTPEEDGFLMVDYRATDSNTNIVITTYDTTVANMVVGSGISTLGSRVNYTIPCIKGHAYRTDRSLARGTIVCRFMPLHG